MKTKILIGFLSLTILSSCKKWLDLKPETLPTDDQILLTSDGYRAILNGLYRTMGGPELYGKDMTFGIVDCVSQQYKLDLGTSVTYNPLYIAAGKFKYDQPQLNTAIGNMWLKGYNVIANANSLLQQMQSSTADMFPQGEMERNLIIGEARAVRGLMHFDLLRIFAPALINDDGQNYLPYVDRYPNVVPTPIAVQPFLQKVVEDLEEGRKLVAKNDTSLLGVGMVITGEARFYNEFSFGTEVYSNSTAYEDFFKGRGYRLNYYAISAILARVYNYMGKYKEAFDLAKKVVDFEVKDYYGMVKAFSQDKYTGILSNNWDTKNDLKTVSNLVFAVHNAKAVDELSLDLHFKREFYWGSYPTWFVINQDAQRTFQTKEGFDESTADIRSVYMIYYANGMHPISGKYFQSETEYTRNRNSMVIPVIRSSELKYIMAEYYARNSDFVNAKGVLTGIRSNRRLTNDIKVTNWSEFQDELIRDARREYISEGQLLYLYKRLNAPVNFGQNVVRPLTKAEYLLPIPSVQL